MKKILMMLLVIAVISTSLIGCGKSGGTNEEGSGAGSGNYGGTLNVVSGAEPNTLDPHYSTTSGEFMPLFHIYETPVSKDTEGNYYPLVCEYEMSDDATKLTLTVREGVTFHDGTAVTSKDIKESLDRWMKARASRLSGFAGILKTETVVDEKTVEYEFTQPAVSALYLMADPDYGAFIMKADIIESLGEDGKIQGYDAANYIGTSPYKFAEWIPNQYIRVVRYDNYVSVDNDASGAAGPRYAYADEIRFMIMTDGATQAMNMMTGDIDYASLSDELAEPLLENKTIYSQNVNNGSSVVFVFNNSEERSDSFIHNIAFRKAILAALDMKGVMLSFVPEDLIIMSPALVKSGTLYYNDKTAKDVWNVNDTELAKKYLQESGYNGEEIVWVTRTSTVNYKPTVVAAEQLKAVGINVKIISVETTASKAYQEDYTGWDVACIMSPTLKEDPCNYTPLQPGYWVKWDSEKKNELYDKLLVTTDSTERQEYIDELTNLLYDELPFIICGSRMTTVYFRTGVEGSYEGISAYFWNTYFTK